MTTRAARGLDEDEPLALAALRRTGVQAAVVDWDDPEIVWGAFDRVVMRSIWNYPQRVAGFLRWLDRVSAVTELVNPPATVRWNLDKRYLAELDAAGVPTAPTEFVGPGSSATFPPGDFVIKPAVGAGSRDAASYGPDQRELATAHIARLHASEQSVLVQPFLTSITAEGEWPLVFVEGRYSHAANKRVSLPRAGVVKELFATEINSAHVATGAQIAVAEAALEVVSARLGTPVYARVDLVRNDIQRFCVLEVELIEPSLFLAYTDSAAVEGFVAALVR